MSLEFTVTAEFPTSASAIYDAWLDSVAHAEMTAGDSAIQSKEDGAEHKAHGDYIWGKNIELVENSKIVQSWRTPEFAEDAEDSIVEVLLEENNEMTKVTLIHSHLPDDGGHFEQGWIEYYFDPMKAYFSGS